MHDNKYIFYLLIVSAISIDFLASNTTIVLNMGLLVLYSLNTWINWSILSLSKKNILIYFDWWIVSLILKL